LKIVGKSNKQCYLCKNAITEVSWQDVQLLKRFITPQAKIASRRRTGVCAKHQRVVAKAIKKARIMGLLPFTTRVIDTHRRKF